MTLPQFVLCYCLMLALFLSSAPNARCCGGQGLPFTSVGASDRPEPAGTRRAPRFTGKALAAPLSTESHCAAVTLQQSLGYSTLQRTARVPLQRWLGYSTLLKAARVPLQPIQLLPPSGLPPQSRNGDFPRTAEGRPAADAGRDLPTNACTIIGQWTILTGSLRPATGPRTSPAGLRTTKQLSPSGRFFGKSTTRKTWLLRSGYRGWSPVGGSPCAVGVRKPASPGIKMIITNCRKDVSDEMLNAIHNRCKLWLP